MISFSPSKINEQSIEKCCTCRHSRQGRGSWPREESLHTQRASAGLCTARGCRLVVERNIFIKQRFWHLHPNINQPQTFRCASSSDTNRNTSTNTNTNKNTNTFKLFWVLSRPGPRSSTSRLLSVNYWLSEIFRPTLAIISSEPNLQDREFQARGLRQQYHY